jgi:acetyl-CoA carboxylase biotin carboxyl carrier protein
VSLTAKDVAQITRLLEESSFDELYLEIDGLKLSLRRGSAANAQAPVEPAAAAETVPRDAIMPRRVTDPTALTDTDANTLTGPNTATVPSPLLGTFYRAPKPGAPPFVEIGSQVAEDTIVGIIEVMKLMNTVRAGVRGKVIQILARDGALVEYGQTLLRVSTTG